MAGRGVTDATNASDDARLARLLRHVRERCAFLPSGQRHFPAADELWAWYRRESVGLTPAEREIVEREIRRGTGT